MCSIYHDLEVFLVSWSCDIIGNVFVYSLNYHILEFHPRKLSLLSLHPPLLTIVMASA